MSALLQSIFGSILALKIWAGIKTRVILKNMDNKSIKNHRKTVSSSYPHPNLSEFVGWENLVFMRNSRKFA